MLVHVRPNGPYLLLLAAAIIGSGSGVASILQGGFVNGLLGLLILMGGGVLLVVLGVPLVVSMLFRVPALVVEEQGVRLPLMGVRLTWAEVSAVRLLAEFRGRARPLLLIVPMDPDGIVRQARPWLRRDARANLARHGTPLVVPGASLNRPLADIAEAIQRYRPGLS